MKDRPEYCEGFDDSRSVSNGRQKCLVTCCFIWMLCIGCGSSNERGYIQHGEDLYPVTGQILFEGRPASNATVILHRTEVAPPTETESDEEVASLNPRGTCDRAGNFQLHTYAAGDGAPAGDFIVTVSWQDPENRGREENYPELLPKRYLLPQSSGLKAHIDSGETVLPPFVLKR